MQMKEIEMTKAERSFEPLLVIGLGGTGIDVLSTVKEVFAQRLRASINNTEFLMIDCDKNAFPSGSDCDAINIDVPGLEPMLGPWRNSALSSAEQSWLDPEMDRTSNGLGGATYRQAARLMLCRNYKAVLDVIRKKMDALYAGYGDAKRHVAIVTGICGGTGSGIFLDIAQIFRHYFDNPTITGYIVMPDVSCARVRAGGEAMQNIMKANGYAALKELDFWMRVGEHKTPYKMQFVYEREMDFLWERPPFDRCYLICGTDTKQNPCENDGYDEMRYTIAEHLLHVCENDGTDALKPSLLQITEANAQAVAMATPQMRPLFYGYGSLGGSTLRIAKQEMMRSIGKKLLGSLVARSKCDNQAMAAQRLANGENTIRAAAFAGNIEQLYKDVTTDELQDPGVELPLEALQKLIPPPYEWEQEELPTAMAKLAEEHLRNAWADFISFAKTVIADPEQGPFCLQAYLMQEGTDDLLPALRSIQCEWESRLSEMGAERDESTRLCRDMLSAFVGADDSQAQNDSAEYADAIKRYLETARRAEFYRAYISALGKLIDRVEQFRDEPLTAMCNDMKEEILWEVSDAPIDGYRVRDFDAYTQWAWESIREQFEQQLQRSLSDACLDGDTGMNSRGDFTFHYQSEELSRCVWSALQHCLGRVEEQSLDKLVALGVGADENEQNKAMDDIAKDMASHSSPLFYEHPAYSLEPKVSYNFFYVPDDSPHFIKRYQHSQNPVSSAQQSRMHDRLYCTTVWEKLPLYRYAMMEDLSKAYFTMLSQPNGVHGLHLVYHPQEKQYQDNWSLLPEPCPSMLMGTTCTQAEQQAYRQNYELVERAIQAGVVTVDDSTSRPSIALHLYYVEKKQSESHSWSSKKEEEICRFEPLKAGLQKRMEAARQTQGEGGGFRAAIAWLNEFYSKAKSISLNADGDPTVMAGQLGLKFGDPINPWDFMVQTDPSQLEVAKQNFKRICIAYAAAVLARYPMYLQGVEQQLKAVEYAKRIMTEGSENA